MSTTSIGRAAEQTAADFLAKKKFKVIAQNWRNRWCEIDIIAKRHNEIFFVEVKYRSNSAQGSGLEYITLRKLRQMSFAAEHWIAQNTDRFDGYSLSAIEVSGTPPHVDNWIPSIN